MRRTRESYCLRCFAATTAGAPGVSVRCPSCGFVTTPVLRREFWNQSSRLIRLERLLKVIVGVIGGLSFLVLVFVGPGLRPGLIFVGVLAVAIGTWESASLLTRRRTYFSPVVFWCSACVICAFAFLPTLLCPVFLAVAGVVLLARRRLVSWRERLTGTGGHAREGDCRESSIDLDAM